MKKAICIDNGDGSFSIKIDKLTAEMFGFKDQEEVEVSFNENAELIVIPNKDPKRIAEIKEATERLIEKYRDDLEQMED